MLAPLVRKTVKFIGFVCFLGYLGVETASIAAAITSVGLTIGLALQGSLSNFAGGVIIILMRPYKIGDYIDCDGFSGTVEDIKLFYTYLTTPDNKEVIIPNGKAGNATVVNYSIKNTRRLDLKFSISYEQDFNKAKEILLNCIKDMGLSLNEPEPFINISEHGSNAIIILTRFWVIADDYWKAHFEMQERVKKAFDENEINIPYNQIDVHLDKILK